MATMNLQKWPSESRVGRTSVYACQLCKPDGERRTFARAVTTIAGLRVCARHLQILIAILEGAIS